MKQFEAIQREKQQQNIQFNSIMTLSFFYHTREFRASLHLLTLSSVCSSSNYERINVNVCIGVLISPFPCEFEQIFIVTHTFPQQFFDMSNVFLWLHVHFSDQKSYRHAHTHALSLSLLLFHQ